MRAQPLGSHFIDGGFVDGDGAQFDSIHPADRSVIARLRAADAATIERAMTSAAKGLAVWRSTPPAARGRVLQRAAEIIREKLTWRLREELPYGLTVEIERFEEQGGRVGIAAIVWVERPGQKAIVIGAGGERLKEIGRLARLEINQLLKKSVHLELWVKVKENWADSEQALKSFGYESP